MEKLEILQELKEKFNDLKKELKFQASYEEINELCAIEDFVLAVGFVSNRFSRQLINHMVESFYSWTAILHSWLMPSPQDMIFMSEANKLTSDEKKEIVKIVSSIMYFVRKNKRIAFERNRLEEGKFIDELMEFDKKVFSNFMIRYSKKFEEAWKNS